MRRILTLALCCLLALTCTAGAAMAEFIAPKLSSDAEPYDSDHPESLLPEQLYASSAILMEASTGKVIFEKNAETRMFPASTTKIMTVYLALLYGDMDATVYLSEQDLYDVNEGDSDMGLEVGESINFKDLLYGTFIRSANEGANLIAETIGGGSISAFVELMNQTAQSMGCTSTHFENPNGLHNENHYTTAYDMAVIARNAMQNDTFRDIAKSYTYSLPKSNLHRARVLTHSSRKFMNPTLEDNEYYYADAIGIKTGFTSEAGYCFVGAAQRNGVELISVVFYSSEAGRWTDTIKLMEYGFSQFISMTPAELYAENPITVQTTNYSMEDDGYGRLQLYCEPISGNRSVRIVGTVSELDTLSRNLKQTVQIEYSRDFTCPIAAGEEMGIMTYYPEDGGEGVQYRLIASRSLEARDDASPTLEEIENRVMSDPNPFPPLTSTIMMMLIPVILVLFVPPVTVILLRRRKQKQQEKEFSHTRRKGKRLKVPPPQNRFYR